MADKKVTQLTALTNLSGDDLLMVVNDPLGTPSSRKVSLTNFYANVAVKTTHTNTVTFKSNTTFSSNKVTMSANLIYKGAELASTLNNKMNVANTNTLVNDRMQVANTTAAISSAVNAYSANTNPRVDTLESQFASTVTSISTQTLYATTEVDTPTVDIASATGLQCTKGSAPSSNNTATEGVPVGTIFFSNNHLYIATDATTIKRVSLEVFS